MHISLFPYHYAFFSPSVLSQPLSRPQIEPNQSHLIKQMPEARINTGFRHFSPLFKLAESGLIQVISTWLSIPFCIDNSYLFHTLFFVSHTFSTNTVPLHFSLLCVVPVACRFVYYSENNHLIVCKSTYGNYNLQAIFLQEKVLWY